MKAAPVSHKYFLIHLSVIVRTDSNPADGKIGRADTIVTAWMAVLVPAYLRRSALDTFHNKYAAAFPIMNDSLFHQFKVILFSQRPQKHLSLIGVHNNASVFFKQLP